MYQTYRVAAPMLRVLWIYPSQCRIGQRGRGWLSGFLTAYVGTASGDRWDDFLQGRGTGIHRESASQRSYGQQGKEGWNWYTNNIYVTSNLKNILGLGGGRVGDVNSVGAGPKVVEERGFEDLSCRSNQGPQHEFLFLGKLGRMVEGVKGKHCYELIAEMGG